MAILLTTVIFFEVAWARNLALAAVCCCNLLAVESPGHQLLLAGWVYCFSRICPGGVLGLRSDMAKPFKALVRAASSVAATVVAVLAFPCRGKMLIWLVVVSHAHLNFGKITHEC